MQTLTACARVTLLCLAVTLPPSVNAIELTGTIDKVIDGDTLWLCDEGMCHKIRLCGVNAPEKGQVGHHESRSALDAIVKGKTVRCVQVGNGGRYPHRNQGGT